MTRKNPSTAAPCANPPPTWHQPVGAWRRRGASSLHIRMALGLPVDKRAATEWETLDTEGRTIWHYWAASPNPGAIQGEMALLMPEHLKNHLDVRGEHPLHRLAMHGQGRMMKEWSLSDPQCAAPARMVDGTTLFHAAAWSGDVDALHWVCEHGSEDDVNAPDRDGLTPLAIAVHRFEPEHLKPLLLAGADPNARDLQKRTCLHHAAQHGLVELIAFMEDIGGDSALLDDSGCSVKYALRESIRRGAEQTAVLRQNWERRSNSRIKF